MLKFKRKDLGYSSNTITIWIPNTWIHFNARQCVRYSKPSEYHSWMPDSSHYQTVWVSGIQMVVPWLGKPFEYHIFGPLTGFIQNGFQTTIWILDTNLPIEYQTTLAFRWLLYHTLKTSTFWSSVFQWSKIKMAQILFSFWTFWCSVFQWSTNKMASILFSFPMSRPLENQTLG